MFIVIFLHVTAMVLGFAMLTAYALACHVAARSASGAFVQMAFRATGKLDLAGRALVVLGIVLGLVAAAPAGYAAPWLLASYALTALAILNGALVLEPFQKRLAAAAQTGQPLHVLQGSRVPAYSALVNGLLWAALIWLMLARP